MQRKLNLLYFDLTQGNRIGSQFILNELGWLKGSRIIALLKWREIFDNPFKLINKSNRPNANQKLSQRQMAPLVIFYQLLLEHGTTQEDAIDLCRRLSREVAVAFLKYSIPPITKAEFQHVSQEKKQSLLNKIASRFFNMESENTMSSEDEFSINVHSCHFATYAKQLQVSELGPIFCESDRFYFENYQDEVDFERTQTLAIDSKPCDFRFKWKEE